MSKNRSLITPVLLASVLLATVLVHLPILNQPFGRDQGIFAYIGDGILHGYVPFRDSWDHKPPGIDFAYALAFAVFGRSMVSVHLLELASVLLTATTLFLLGRRFHGAATGIVASALYGTGSAFMFEWWDRGQAEFFMTLPLALSAYCAARAGVFELWDRSAPQDTRSLAIWLGVGAFFAGTALYFKPTAGVMLAFLGFQVVLTALATRAIRSAAVGAVATLLGALVAMIPLLAYFAMNGALGDLYEAVILFNTYHVQTGANLTLAQMIAATVDFGARMGFLGPLAVLGAITVTMRRQAGGISVALWLVFLTAGIWVQGKFFSYHWSTLLAPLALLAAIGLRALWADIANRSSRMRSGVTFARATPLANLAIIALPFLALSYGVVLYRDQTPKLGRDLPFFLSQTGEQDYLANFGHNLRGVDVYSFSAAQETARYVADRTQTGDTVLVWGFQALVNFLADRRAPTRYVFNYPLTIDQPDSDLRAKARRTFLEELGRSKPKYIILVTNDVNPLQVVDSVTLLDGFAELKTFIAAEYALEKDIADFHIYKRKGA